MILGISGSPRKDEISGVYKLVKIVLENTGCAYELVSLRNKNIAGCVACLKCVEDNVCKVKDDFQELRESILDADAYVIGSPNYYSGINVLTHAFLERWFQFRHREGDLLWGKIGVAVGVGGTSGKYPADEIERFFNYNFIETVAKVEGQGAASCYYCGYGDSCKVGIPYFLYGENADVSEENVPDVTRQQDVVKSAAEAGRELGRLVREGYDRSEVTGRMQQRMMEMLKGS